MSSPRPVAIIPRPATRTRGKNNNAPMKAGSRTNTSARRLLTTALERLMRLCYTHGAVCVAYVNLASGEEALAASPQMRGAIDSAQFAQLRKEAKARSWNDEYTAMPDGFETVDTDVPNHHVLYRPPADGGRMFVGRKRQRSASLAKADAAGADNDEDGGSGDEDGGDDDDIIDTLADGGDEMSPEDWNALLEAFASDASMPAALAAAVAQDEPAAVVPQQAPDDGLAALADMARNFRAALACVSLDISAR